MEKRSLSLIAFLMMLAVLSATACRNVTQFIEPESVLDVDTTSLEFEADGGTLSFTVTAYNVDWTVSHVPSAGSWQFTTGDEGENKAVIEYTLPANETDEVYTDYFEISAPDMEPKIISITLAGQVFSPVLIAYPDLLTFLSNASSGSFFVTAEHVDKWEIQTSDTWYTYDIADTPDEDGRYEVMVSVGDYDGTEDRYGELQVTAEGVESQTVEIVQFCPAPEAEEPENIWQRSYRSRMNLRGVVQEVSSYVNFFTLDQITDLNFGQDGMIQSFGVDYMGYGTRTVRVDALYDDIYSLNASWDGGGYFTIELTYGSHGKYIPVWEFFQKMEESSISLEYTAWMPRVIYNLESVDITYHEPDEGYGETDGTVSAKWTVSGNTALLNTAIDYSYGSSTYIQSITFNGEYPQSIHTGDGNIYDYEMNPSNGYMVSYAEYYEGSEPSGYTHFNEDNINSISSNDSPESWSGFTTTYDEYLNLTSCTYGHEAPTLSFSITYPGFDRFGNWTEAIVFYTFQELTYDRTITYYE